MVGIVESVHEIFVKRVNVLQSREAIEDSLELFCKSFCGELDLSRVKSSYTRDLEAGSDLCGKSSLRATQHNVNEFL